MGYSECVQDIKEVAKQPKDRHGMNHHVYGNRAALTVELDENRSGYKTVAFDGAAKSGLSVAWNKKIRFQLTHTELPILTCLFLGMIDELRFDYHGEAKNKSLHVVRRPPNILVRVIEGTVSHTVPLVPGDSHVVGTLLLQALTSNCIGLDVAGHLAVLKSTCALYKATPQPALSVARAPANAADSGSPASNH